MMSRLVLSQGVAPQFSHVGVVVLERGRAIVVHAMPQEGERSGGVVAEALAQFASPAEAAEVAVYRVAGLHDAQRRLIRDSALAEVGEPFDDRFRLSDTRKAYCTAVVLRAFRHAGVQLVDSRAQVVVPLLPEPVIPPDHLRRFALEHLQLILQMN